MTNQTADQIINTTHLEKITCVDCGCNHSIIETIDLENPTDWRIFECQCGSVYCADYILNELNIPFA